MMRLNVVWTNQESGSLTFAAKKLPVSTLTPISCKRLLSPCLRILQIEGPGDNLASSITDIAPAASLAACKDAASVTL